MRIRFTIPEVKNQPEARPQNCPHCGSQGLYLHGYVLKHLIDHKLSTVQAIRYQCKTCQKTFRHYPPGVDHAQQSAATKVMGILLWVLGLSYDNVSNFLRALGCGIAKATAWGDVQEAGEKAKKLRKRKPLGRVRLMGIDTTGYKVRGEQIVAGIVTDGLSGEVLELEILGAEEAEEIKAWIKDLVEELGVEVLISDDDDTYKIVADDLHLQQQICIAHVRKWVTKRTKELIEGAQVVLAKKAKAATASKRARADPQEQELLADCLKLREIIKELKGEGQEELERLHFRYLWARPPKKGQQASLWYRMRLMTLRLLEAWPRLVLYQRKELAKLLDGTNNVTERAIGRCGKIRYKTMRGYKSRGSWEKTNWLLAWLGMQGEKGWYNAGELVA